MPTAQKSYDYPAKVQGTSDKDRTGRAFCPVTRRRACEIAGLRCLRDAAVRKVHAACLPQTEELRSTPGPAEN